MIKDVGGLVFFTFGELCCCCYKTVSFSKKSYFIQSTLRLPMCVCWTITKFGYVNHILYTIIIRFKFLSWNSVGDSTFLVCKPTCNYISSRKLNDAKQNFTTASLGLLANYRKRQQLIALLKSLKTIKTLVSIIHLEVMILWFTAIIKDSL